MRLQMLIVWVPLAFAQDPTGVLQGRVTDPSGAIVAKANVTAQNVSTSFTATQQSSQDGSFHFSYLPVGEYDLRVSSPGFADFEATHLRIDVDRVVDFSVALEIRPKGEVIEISANAATVDVSSTLGNVVSAREASRSSS